MCQKSCFLTILLAGLVVIVPCSAQTEQPADEVKRARERLEEARKELEKARQVYEDILATKRALEEKLEAAKKEELELKAQREKLQQQLKDVQAAIDRLNRLRGAALPVETDARPKIEGKVKEVQDSGSIILSIGSEAGLKKGDTLEVYRLKPKPLYLGQIVITELKAKEAIARQIRKRPSGGEPICAGDEVSTRIGID
jgi:myosin heavy subunit